MLYNAAYYRDWLLQLEMRELEVAGIVLAIEVEIHEIQKVIHLLREANEEEDFLLGSLLLSQIQFKNRVRRYSDELEEIGLDISHCRFMINQLNNLER